MFLVRVFLVITLIAALTLGSVCCIKTGQKDGSSSGNASDDPWKPFLAHDAKTGEYIGTVIMECTDWENKKARTYKIRLKDGKVIERSAESITIDSP